MKLDAHQHFWRYDAKEYPWISDHMQELRRDYLPEDLGRLLVSIGFDGSIAVQARQTIQETEWLLDLARKRDLIKGVVGWVDLRSPMLRDQLRHFSAEPKLVSVRHVLQDETDDHFMLRPDFVGGIGQLQEFGLAYDLLIFPRHLPVAVELVRRFPGQRFVLDHLGKPAIRDGQLSPWREDLRRLAGFPNVYCKLSGMVTEAEWRQWREDDFHRYLDVTIECFGPSRVMIGSDWPVCTLSGEYAATMGIVMRYVEQFSETDRAGILGGNCEHVYRLGLRQA